MPSRHGTPSGGTKTLSTARLPCTRAVYGRPPRSRTCGSPTANAAATASSSRGPSASTSTMRPGCSVCAERTGPRQTAAPAKSVTSSPGSATAPRVDHHQHARVSFGQPGPTGGQRVVRGRVTPATGSRSAGSDRRPGTTRLGAGEAAGAGDQSTSNSRSPPEPDSAAFSCWSVTGRATMDVTDSTGNRKCR